MIEMKQDFVAGESAIIVVQHGKSQTVLDTEVTMVGRRRLTVKNGERFSAHTFTCEHGGHKFLFRSREHFKEFRERERLMDIIIMSRAQREKLDKLATHRLTSIVDLLDGAH